MMGWMAPLRHLGARGAGWDPPHPRRVSFVARLAHYMQHLHSDHIRGMRRGTLSDGRLRYAEID